MITIKIPEGVKAVVENNEIIISGKLGEIRKKIASPLIEISVNDREITIKQVKKGKKAYAIARTYEKHIYNMFKGVEKGYTYKLVIRHSHFPINVNVKGNVVEITNFLGERKPRIAKIMPNTKVEVKNKEIYVKSIDKEAAGQTAANIKQATRLVGRDRRVFQDGIYFVEKAKEGM